MSGEKSSIDQEILDQATFAATFEIISKTPWISAYPNRSAALVELYKLTASKNEWDVVQHLIQKFKYIDESNFMLYKTKIAEKIVAWMSKEYIIQICTIADPGEIDGSQLLLQSIKNADEFIGVLKKEQFLNSITEPIIQITRKPVRKKRRLVLIDDFIGSGKTINTKVNWLRQALAKNGLNDKVDIKICSMARMSKSDEALKPLLLDGSISEVFSPLVLKRGITDYFEGGELIAYKNCMSALENKLGVKYQHLWLSQYKFGYDKSESLFSWEDHNIPNNVFPIFWWPSRRSGNKQKTIFRRIV